MSTYLLEIGTEELPAAHIPESESRLKELMTEALTGANLKFGEISTMSTPRRLTLIIKGLADKQDTIEKKQKGPPLEKSFDADGKPTGAAKGFAEKNGLTVEQLSQEEIGGVKYIVANLTIQGKPAQEVLATAAPTCISQLSGERLMRWGSSDFKFSRPIRWIVSLLDDKVVPFALDRLTAARTTMGHRVLAPGEIEIKTPDTYVSQLKDRKVMVDPQERRKVIQTQVADAAKNLKGSAKQLSGSLLDEVVYITEWPHAVVGDFAVEYLDLPDALIETIMVHHQRYFPIEKANGDANHEKIKSSSSSRSSSPSISQKSLLPHFITVANNDRAEAQKTIKLGNERVLKARLADGRFFYFDDQKTKLTDRNTALAQLTFQRGLGTYAQKVERLLELSKQLTKSLQLEAKYSVPLERAVELCKLDLVTNLVRELPELQGYVGAWYAELEKQPPEVVQAIASHYSPRSTDDTIPGDTVGQLTAVLDKLDNLTALFALGTRPSGSSDPFALRRQAQGIVDILIDGLPEHAINISELIAHDLRLVEHFLDAKKREAAILDKCAVDLADFLLQRLRGKLLDMGFGRETIEAVLAARDPFVNVHDVLHRCRCIDQLLATDMDLVRAGVRIGNILKPDSRGEVDEALFANDAEKSLWKAFKSFKSQTSQTSDRCSTEDEYMQLLKQLSSLSKPVDEYFVKTMVNDKQDKRLSQNRHAMLERVDRYFKKIADFPKLQSLLPSV